MIWGLPINPIDAPAYEWDTWSAKDYVLVGVSNLPAECLEISTSARIALTTAIAEIIHELLARFDRDDEARYMIQAAWASTAPGYSIEVVLPDRPDDRGPGPEPLRVMVTILFDMLRGEGGQDRCLTLAWMDALARHVLEDSDAYAAWFDGAVDRLTLHHPEPPTDIFSHVFSMGPPVDRDLFDLSLPYTSDPSVPALARYLSNAAAENPYIEPTN
jgi:hypothetical protein